MRPFIPLALLLCACGAEPAPPPETASIDPETGQDAKANAYAGRTMDGCLQIETDAEMLKCMEIVGNTADQERADIEDRIDQLDEDITEGFGLPPNE